MAGVSRLRYANEIRVIRVMCSGRVDLEYLLRAFSNGHDGVFIGGCRLGECNYVTQGNFDAFGLTLLTKKIMSRIGLDPERLRTVFMNASDGILLAETINDFSKKIHELGPLGRGEGLDPGALKFKLDALRRLVPYIRLVERERLRVPVKNKDAYEKFFASDQVDRLIDELILDKLAVSQITALLREKPLTTAEISAALSLSPSDVSKYLNVSSKQGFIRFDREQKRFAPA